VVPGQKIPSVLLFHAEGVLAQSKAETFCDYSQSKDATGAFYPAILLHRLFRPTDG
jgi:hypothetical protein